MTELHDHKTSEELRDDFWQMVGYIDSKTSQISSCASDLCMVLGELKKILRLYKKSLK
jgi:hypothetical protein